MGHFESLNPAITIWVKTSVSEAKAIDLHHAAPHSVRKCAGAASALQGSSEIVFLGVQPPLAGVDSEPIFVGTVSVSLIQK